MEQRTKLATYLETAAIRRSAFARMVGVTPGRITQICNGEAPSLAVAVAIEKATAGVVKAADLAPSTKGPEAA